MRGWILYGVSAFVLGGCIDEPTHGDAGQPDAASDAGASIDAGPCTPLGAQWGLLAPLGGVDPSSDCRWNAQTVHVSAAGVQWGDNDFGTELFAGCEPTVTYEQIDASRCEVTVEGTCESGGHVLFFSAAARGPIASGGGYIWRGVGGIVSYDDGTNYCSALFEMNTICSGSQNC